ncbi:hypothetical protein EE612_059178, partial [Oryza sativa]
AHRSTPPKPPANGKPPIPTPTHHAPLPTHLPSVRLHPTPRTAANRKPPIATPMDQRPTPNIIHHPSPSNTSRCYVPIGPKDSLHSPRLFLLLQIPTKSTTQTTRKIHLESTPNPNLTLNSSPSPPPPLFLLR